MCLVFVGDSVLVLVGVDILLINCCGVVVVGLGGVGELQCDDIVCVVELGDCFLLLFMCWLMVLDLVLLVQVLVLFDCDSVCVCIVYVCVLGIDFLLWLLVVIEIVL